MSSGNISKLKVDDIKNLISSTYKENTTPKITPVIDAKKPIVNPVRKNTFVMDFLLIPNVLSIAISFVLFFTKIVKPEIILNAATIIINVRIMNITFLSTFSAAKKDLFKSAQEYT